MRRRSGGFHCQTLEEFIEVCEKTNQDPPPGQMTQFKDIQSYLTHQTHLLPKHSDQNQSCQHQEEQQLRDEEEVQLSSEDPRTSSTTITIAMVCDDLLGIRSHLLNPKQIKETFVRLYKDKLPRGREISLVVESHVVSISSMPKSEKDHPKEKHRKITEKIRNKLSKLYSTFHGDFFRRRKQLELQFITYTDTVLSLPQEDGIAAASAQLKIWLIQKQQTYSTLHQTYINLANCAFEAKEEDNSLKLSQLNIDDTVQSTTQSFDETLSGIYARGKSSLVNKN